MHPARLSWLTPRIAEIQQWHAGHVAALYSGKAPDSVMAIAGRCFGASHGLAGANEIDMLADPDAWLDDVLADMAANAEEAADPVTFRPLVIELDPLGVHFVDALFGSHVFFNEGQVWAGELPFDLANLTMPDLAHSPLLAASLRLAQRAVSISEGRLYVTTPVLSCPINIAINLFGQRMLTALVERPAAAERALRIITDVILACTRVFCVVIPPEIRRVSVAESRYAPPGFGLIDGCATQLVSAQHYRRFFAPLDAEVLGAYPRGGLMHLCGAHAQHIPAFRDMTPLRAVQLNDRAVDDLARYYEGLREDQLLYVIPTDAFPVERILQITGGRRTILAYPIQMPIPVAGVVPSGAAQPALSS